MEVSSYCAIFNIRNREDCSQYCKCGKYILFYLRDQGTYVLEVGILQI